MKEIFTLLFICSFSLLAKAQDNYEIQVYGSQTQSPNSTIFELHSNYTFNGEKDIVKGVRPSYHALHETLEITHGISNIFELGFYLFTNYTADYGYRIIGSHIRPRIMAPQEWHLPVGLSLSTEFGYQSQEYSTDTWSLEIRPIIDKQINKLYLCLNPTFGVSIKSVDKPSAPTFEPNIKTSYAFFKNASIGLEYYGSLGAVTQFDPLQDQTHAIFLVYDLMNSKNWELNIGPGLGLTKATDGFVFKVLVGRRVFWKKK